MYLIIFFICAFLFLYLRGKEKETHPKKKKPRNSSHHPHFVRLRFFIIGLKAQPTVASQTRFAQTVLGNLRACA